MNPAILGAAPADAIFMRSLFSIGFLARFSYALARNPVLPLFAVALGAGPVGIGLAVGISTVTDILFSVPWLWSGLCHRCHAALCFDSFVPHHRAGSTANGKPVTSPNPIHRQH